MRKIWLFQTLRFSKDVHYLYSWNGRIYVMILETKRVKYRVYPVAHVSHVTTSFHLLRVTLVAPWCVSVTRMELMSWMAWRPGAAAAPIPTNPASTRVCQWSWTGSSNISMVLVAEIVAVLSISHMFEWASHWLWWGANISAYIFHCCYC